MRRVVTGWMLVCALSLLSACVSSTRKVERIIDGEAPLPTASPGQDRRVHLDLIRRMLAQNQNYAALAHIQAQQRQGSSEELRLLEADARRKLGQRPAAQQIYQSLLKSPYAANAYHGLGLLAASSNDSAQSLLNLRRAVYLLPTDIEMRNDLGYALILARRYPEALPEVATAVELDPGNPKSRNNLLLLMILMRDESSVQRIVRESSVDATTLANLRKQAASLASAAPPRPSVQAVPAPVAAPKKSKAG